MKSKQEETSPSSSKLVIKVVFFLIQFYFLYNFKRWEYQTTSLASWETYMQVRKQQLELDMKQQTGSK